MNEEFSKERLDELFNCDVNNKLLVSESYDVEYKENFNIDADIIKTMSGLANNRGGYIIFGVEPSQKKLKGIKQTKIDFYLEKIDREEVRGKILSACQPNIEYKHYLHTWNGLSFIVFYIPESKNKPHIFSNSNDDVRPGDIFYRYNDSIKKIQYAELNSIIENKRLKEQEKWMRFLGEIAKIGLDNALIIDAKNGKMISSDNYENGIVLDESVLSKFKLIKEGQFNEITGDPTLKIIGNLSFQTESGRFELSTNLSSVLDSNKTHPYRYCDILKKLIEENVKTSDKKFINQGNVTYHRIRFFINNNNLNTGLENIYTNNFGQKTFSNKVYEAVKNGFSRMTLSEIENLKLIEND